MNQPATVSLTVTVEVSGQPLVAGTAYVGERRRAVSTVFRYDADYQRDRRAYSISPELPLGSTTHQVDRLPGTLADSAPDRWGRNLIFRRRSAERDGHAAAPSLTEVDYLLGVSDLTRQGGLHVALHPGGPFLAPDLEVPKLLELPALLHAADVVAGDDTDESSLAAVKLLLDAGSGSLGGARPKASVRDGERLLIAKFPHRSDQWNVMAWEKTALDLAEQAGISVPERRLVDLDGRSALLLRRFDRRGDERVGYASAMTMVSGHDGGSYDYLEVVDALTEHGDAVDADLVELWRRIAFSRLINNTDDHLRNHGFLRGRTGWALSPAFDINPNPDTGVEHSTTIGWTSGTRSDGVAVLLQHCGYFGLSRPAAERIWADQVAAAGN